MIPGLVGFEYDKRAALIYLALSDAATKIGSTTINTMNNQV